MQHISRRDMLKKVNVTIVKQRGERKQSKAASKIKGSNGNKGK